MIPGEFDYAAPASLEEATRLLSGTPGAKVLAGGMSLIPAMKHRLSQPPLLVDIGRIAELEGISERRGRLRIGGRTRHAALVEAPELAGFPLFGEAAALIGDVQVRNRGTFGGSLVHADPAADWPAVFLALDGEATLVGPRGKRIVKAGDFFVGMLASAAGEGELLTEIEFSMDRKRAGTAYRKLRHPASGFAVVGVAVQLTVDRKGRVDDVAIGVTGVNPVPFRARSLEARLRGLAPSTDELRGLCAQVEEADPMEDPSASAEYRRHLLGVHAARAVGAALERTGR